MHEPLTLQAQVGARDKLRALAVIRLFSAVALTVPTLACTAFLWSQSRVLPDPEYPGMEQAADAMGAGMLGVVWSVWVPLALMALIVAGVFAWLGLRAWEAYKREYRLGPDGFEVRGWRGAQRVAWGGITLVETGDDLIVHAGERRWAIELGWAGAEQIAAAEAYLKGALGKEKFAPAPSRLARTLLSAVKAGPIVLILLVLMIAFAGAYWAFFREMGEGPDALLRVGPEGEQLVVPDPRPAR